MGTTLTALQSGNANTVYVVAIEGYPYLLTNHNSTAAVVTAWSGTEWTQALPGLFVNIAPRSQMNPWKPFMGGGSCELYVKGTRSQDTLGTHVGRSVPAAETEITSTVGRFDTTINVKRTADFPAATAEAWIGNECIEYTAVGATTFTVGTRGKYSPFPSGDADPSHWPRYHRVPSTTTSQLTSAIQPKVTSTRVQWSGAWCGVWEHRVVDGVLDSKAQAQLVFAGQIGDYGDDPDEMGTMFKLRHVLDIIADTNLFQDQYRARVQRGVMMWSNIPFRFRANDNQAGTGLIANTLDAVASGASGANQINENVYSAEQLVTYMTTWLQSEKSSSRLKGNHVCAIEGGYFTLRSTFPSAGASDTNRVQLSCHPVVARFLGFPNNGGNPTIIYLDKSWQGPDTQTYYAPFPVKLVDISDQFKTTLTLSDEQGEFLDNSAYLPAGYASYYDGTNPVGLFLLDGKTWIVGRVSGGRLVDAQLASVEPAIQVIGPPPLPSHATGTEIVQVFVLSPVGGFAEAMAYILMSTGENGLNDSAYDALPYSLGANLPGYLATSGDLQLSGFSLPIAGGAFELWLSEPTLLAEAIDVDLIFRGAFLAWRNGGLLWKTFTSPVANAATLTLTEDNKAEPSKNIVGQRTGTIVDGGTASPVVKIDWDYDPIEGKYSGTPIVLQDPIAYDSGEAALKPRTLKARNWGSGPTAVQNVEALVPVFFALWFPLLSRPMTKMRRSIAPSLFEGHSAGEVAIISDGFSRDPATGTRIVSARPGLVLSYSYNPGGLRPDGGTAPMTGEVDLMVMPNNRFTIWSPSAEVDSSVSGGGYTNGYASAIKTLSLETHAHSAAVEGADASNFVASDAIEIVEVDPTATPDSYLRNVVSVTGNLLVHDGVMLGAGGGEAAWSATKRYRVRSRSYTNAAATQKTDAYQADDTDGMIVDVAPPYHYGIPDVSPIIATSAAHTDLAALDLGAVGYGDGVPLDTGFHRDLVRTVNNLMDHRTAHHSPNLTTLFTYDALTGSGTYKLAAFVVKHFGLASFGLVQRQLAVSLFWRSSSGTTNGRVTLSPVLPRVDALGDMLFESPYSQVSFSTSSATFVTSSEGLLDLRVMDGAKVGYMFLELTAHAEVYGFGQCIERERT